MGRSANSRVQTLIDDTNEAFLSCGGCINSDYADFASMAIAEFRQALDKPSLRRDDLVKLLRKSMQKSRCENQAQWSILMSHHVTNSVSNYDTAVEKAA